MNTSGRPIGGNFDNMGARNGAVSEIPAYAKAGATQEDLSCVEYTGNPRDSAGKIGTTGDANNVPNTGVGIVREQAK